MSITETRARSSPSSWRITGGGVSPARHRQRARPIDPEPRIIVIDDLSGDDSVRIVEECAARDGRVRLIILERNCGPAGARNRGLNAARGEWIAVVDSDDMIHSDRLRI